MAPFAFDPLDEEQKKKEQDQTAQVGAPAMTGGGETFGSNSAQFNAEPTQKGLNKQGSGFVNLDQYMNANKGNNFGQQVTGKVQDSVQGAKHSLDQAGQDFTQASNQGTTNWGDIGSTVSGIVDKAGSGTSADDVAKVRGYANVKYNGPTDFAGSAWGQQAQGSIRKAAQEGKALQSEGGRFALLDQYYGRPKYSSGEKTLDNLFIQNTPGVAAKSSAIGNQASLLANQAGVKNTELSNLAATNAQGTADTAQKTKDYVTNAASQLQGTLTDRLNAAKTKNAGDYDRLTQDIQNGTLSDEDYAMLGLAPGSAAAGIDLSKYLSKTDDPTLAQVASTDDYARAKALAQLAGEDDSSFLSSTTIDQADSAGNGYQFDKAGYEGAVKDQKQAQDEAYKSVAPDGFIGQTGIKASGDLQTDIKNLTDRLTQLVAEGGWGKLSGLGIEIQKQIDALTEQFAASHPNKVKARGGPQTRPRTGRRP
jgi:hypothetical protein